MYLPQCNGILLFSIINNEDLNGTRDKDKVIKIVDGAKHDEGGCDCTRDAM